MRQSFSNDLDAYDGNNAGDNDHVNVHAMEGNEGDQIDTISSASEAEEDDDDSQLIEMYEEQLNEAAAHSRSAKHSEVRKIIFTMKLISHISRQWTKHSYHKKWANSLVHWLKDKNEEEEEETIQSCLSSRSRSLDIDWN